MLEFLLLFIAAICFALATFGVTIWRINLVAAGWSRPACSAGS